VLFLDCIKECYEGFVILSFLDLMYSFLGVSSKKEVDASIAGRHMHLAFPLGLILGNNTHLDQRTLANLRLCATQFVYLRPALSVLLLAIEMTGIGEHLILPINIILYISITVAVCSLMSFYHTFEKELRPHRPLAKFLCIKGVVFFASAQSTILRLLVHYGVVHESHWYSTAQVSDAIQNLLVCLEMGAIFSFAHNYAFDPAPYAKALKDGAPATAGVSSKKGD
jgi:hypothetical protein